jgi:hypothetical protein
MLHLQRVEITILKGCTIVTGKEDSDLRASHNTAALLLYHDRQIDAAPPTKYRSGVGIQEAQESS